MISWFLTHSLLVWNDMFLHPCNHSLLPAPRFMASTALHYLSGSSWVTCLTCMLYILLAFITNCKLVTRKSILLLFLSINIKWNKPISTYVNGYTLFTMNKWHQSVIECVIRRYPAHLLSVSMMILKAFYNLSFSSKVFRCNYNTKQLILNKALWSIWWQQWNPFLFFIHWRCISVFMLNYSLHVEHRQIWELQLPIWNLWSD